MRYEHITHSICTLEFEDQRPFYDWLLDHLREGGLIDAPAAPVRVRAPEPDLCGHQQAQAQAPGGQRYVTGWDDPRMPTIVGLRRRGYTPASIRNFCERIGVTKDYSWIDYARWKAACAKTWRPGPPRHGGARPAQAGTDQLGRGVRQRRPPGALQPARPAPRRRGRNRAERRFTLGREVWIEREDFAEAAAQGLQAPVPGNKVRLKGGYVIECTGCEKDADGNVTKVLATVVPDTKSGTPGADSVKVKAAITWVGVADGVQAEVRLYDRLFTDAQPDAGGKDFLALLNPDSLKVVTAYVEPSLAAAQAETSSSSSASATSSPTARITRRPSRCSTGSRG
jgi:glutaminyl-tRNA synthetase